MAIEDLHFNMSESWDSTAREFQNWKIHFPLAMGRFYAAVGELGKNLVKDELMNKVYSQPWPPRTKRTLRTLYAVKSSWTALRSTVFIDRRSFRFFYPFILEHGRRGTRYIARNYFRNAMVKMKVLYFREARSALKDFLFERGLT